MGGIRARRMGYNESYRLIPTVIGSVVYANIGLLSMTSGLTMNEPNVPKVPAPTLLYNDQIRNRYTPAKLERS
jgi:hypothetical protein